MQETKLMETQVPVPGKGSSVWRRILIPVLCATVVTVFSLRFYNHRQLERLEAQKMKIKHVAKRVAPHEAYGAKSPGHGFHRNMSSFLQRHDALQKGRNNKDLPSWMESGGDNQGPARKDRKPGAPGRKVRREIRNIRAPKLGAKVNFGSAIQSDPRTTTPVGTAPQGTPSFLGVLWPFRKHLSGSSPTPGYSEFPSTTNIPSIANGDDNAFIGRVKQETLRKQSIAKDKNLFGNFKFGLKQPSNTDRTNGTLNKAGTFSVLGVQKPRDSDRDTIKDGHKNSLVHRKSIIENKSNSADSHNKGHLTSNPVRNTSLGNETTIAKETTWKSRQLKVLGTSSDQIQNPPNDASSIVPQQRSDTQLAERTTHLQQAWDKSLHLIASQKPSQNPIDGNHPSHQTALKMPKGTIFNRTSESRNPDVESSQIQAKQPMHMPLSWPLPTKYSLSSLLSKGLSTKQPPGSSLPDVTLSMNQSAGGLALNRSMTAKQPSAKLSSDDRRVQSADPTQTFKSDSLDRVGKQPLHSAGDQPVQTNQSQQQKKVTIRAPPVNIQEIWDNSIRESDKPANREVKMSQRNYPGESQSIQEIWDNSIAQQLPNVKDPLQKPVQNGQPPIPQYDLSNKSQKLPPKSVVEVPEVNLQSADLPPLSMRSKIMEFSFKPQLGKKYAVIGVAAMGTDYNYVFGIPLTVLSWQRIGCGCIVFLVGSEKYWVSNPILYYVLKELRRLDPVVLFLDAPKEHWIFLSQVSRLFGSNLFDWRGMESTLLITSDSDIWPLTKEMYDMPEDKKVISLNSDCCGTFQHRGERYKMVPMCNIVMSVATWREVMGAAPSGTQPSSVKDFIDYLKAEFGDVAAQRVSKGENDGWFLDQHTVSVRLRQWELRHHKDLVLYAPRDTGRDRIDRSHWFPYVITRSNDIHMLEHLYQPGTWERALPLLRQMYNETKNKNLEQYRDGFIRMLLNYKVSN